MKNDDVIKNNTLIVFSYNDKIKMVITVRESVVKRVFKNIQYVIFERLYEYVNPELTVAHLIQMAIKEILKDYEDNGCSFDVVDMSESLKAYPEEKKIWISATDCVINLNSDKIGEIIYKPLISSNTDKSSTNESEN